MDNVIEIKSKDFALKIVELYKYLVTDKKEFVLSKQILRSGTSIGANIREGLCGQSKKDFFAKFYISYKETNETLYWLELLYKSNYINTEIYTPLHTDCLEIFKILTSITKTIRTK